MNDLNEHLDSADFVNEGSGSLYEQLPGSIEVVNFVLVSDMLQQQSYRHLHLIGQRCLGHGPNCNVFVTLSLARCAVS